MWSLAVGREAPTNGPRRPELRPGYPSEEAQAEAESKGRPGGGQLVVPVQPARRVVGPAPAAATARRVGAAAATAADNHAATNYQRTHGISGRVQRPGTAGQVSRLRQLCRLLVPPVSLCRLLFESLPNQRLEEPARP